MAVQEGTFSILANKMMFANKLSLLYKATADDESPTPGYMFQEITNISYESGSHCQDLLDVLVDRLQEQSCHVKLKVLRIMKHVVEKGHPDFVSGLRKKAHGVQAAAKHSGPPDPLHGNMPYLVVRNEAKTLLSIVYDVKDVGSPASPDAPPKHMASARVKGRAGGDWDDEASSVPLARQKESSVVRPPPEKVEEETSDSLPDYASEEKLITTWLQEAIDEDTVLPTRKQVEVFVNQCSTLNCDRIVVMLAAYLNSEKDGILMCTMLALERLLHLDLVGADYLADTCVSHLQLLSNRPDGPVKSKAWKILRILEKICSNEDLFSTIQLPQSAHYSQSAVEPSCSAHHSEVHSSPLVQHPSQARKLFDHETEASPPLDFLNTPFASHEA